MAAISNARAAAFQALQAVAEGANADDQLHGSLLEPLAERDRALATALVMGVLRWQLLLDEALLSRLRNPDTTAPEVLIALRLGLFQLWFLDRVPPHAAIAESVELARKYAGPPLAGVANAVLRRIQREALPRRDALRAQAPWMLERWRSIYGSAAAELIAKGSQQEPVRYVRAAAGDFTYGPPGNLLAASRVAADISDGMRVQDEGSQMVAEIAAAACPGASMVWDTCAAPGGKTAVLAEMLPSAHILATDISTARMQRTRDLFPAELNARVDFQLADLTSTADRENAASVAADLVLCDVPCSGTGTLARNPEIRLRMRPEDLRRQSERQLKILETAWRGVKGGGTLVYSTCSLEPEENADVVTTFLAGNPVARATSIARILDAMEARGQLHPAGAGALRAHAPQGNFLQTLPGTIPCDGFFVAILRKAASSIGKPS